MNGATVDALNDQGCTPLHQAVVRGHTTAIRALLTAGADVTFRTVDKGKSGLDLVAEEGHVDTARVIIEHGGDVDAVGTDGSSPLHRAAVAM